MKAWLVVLEIVRVCVSDGDSLALGVDDSLEVRDWLADGFCELVIVPLMD